MYTFTPIGSVRTPFLALVAAVILSACGGGGSDPAQPAPPDSLPSTGMVGLLITDKPTDEFTEINLTVTEAVLIGGDDGQQPLFEGSKHIDLLDLTNYSEPVVFGEVETGTYTKLRLYIDNLELVPKDGSAPIYPKLPANGKIDLLDQDGFTVRAGQALLAVIDMDANKSIKITRTGNGRKINFRPVVKVEITDDSRQGKLARVEGTVSDDPLPAAGSFALCDLDTQDNCVDVSTGDDTSFFDGTGGPTDFSSVNPGETAVVIGRYDLTSGVVLNAVVVEVGGNAEQVKGTVASEPMDDEFLLLASDNGAADFVVELQVGTRFFDPDGETDVNAVVLGADVDIDGVVSTDPDRILAALVFVEADDDDELSGTIADDPDASTRSFMLTPSGGGNPVCVRVDEDADILLVNATDSEVTKGAFADLAVDQAVDLFGETATDSCFEANEVIVEVMP